MRSSSKHLMIWFLLAKEHESAFSTCSTNTQHSDQDQTPEGQSSIISTFLWLIKRDVFTSWRLRVAFPHSLGLYVALDAEESASRDSTQRGFCGTSHLGRVVTVNPGVSHEPSAESRGNQAEEVWIQARLLKGGGTHSLTKPSYSHDPWGRKNY